MLAEGRGSDACGPEHRRGPHGVVPVNVPEHLVLGEQQRLEGGHALLLHADLEASRLRILQQQQRVQQPVHVHVTIRNAAEASVTLQVLDLVEIEAAAHEALQWIVR